MNTPPPKTPPAAGDVTASVADADAAAALRVATTLGTGATLIYRLATEVVRQHLARRPRSGDGTAPAAAAPSLCDIGCGVGSLHAHVAPLGVHYVGVDFERRAGFPADAEFRGANLELVPWPVEPGAFDIVTSLEVIEHVENPRAHVRQLVRLVRPGGLVLVSTPNQLSILSLATLVVKRQFQEFQERPGMYPTHITALLEIDLLRIARECGLVEPAIHFPGRGRIVGTGLHWPPFLGGRRFSDNVLMSAVRPA